MPNQEVIELRNRILGILIQNARARARVTPRECAAALGLSEEDYLRYERGLDVIALPQLEFLARFLKVPITAFRTTEALTEATKPVEMPTPEVFLPLRHRIVGARLRQARLESNRTVQDMADMLECSPEIIADYEYGRRPIPLAVLELVGRALNLSLDYFLDKDSEIGQWHQLQQQFARMTEMPPELREFVLRPINRSYLDIALKLSKMPAGTLRAIAEGLLEITY